ncbi:MAG: macro domain-containing protein [Balneolaceae bacterium]|nr:MAG: macro domain-containing protein [Balneolaceae bacterium]
MTENYLNNILLEVVQGDITRQPDCTAIVNAANAQLRTGGGVAGAIHRIGDPELTIETREFAPIKPGETVITSAPNFPNKYIIHCLGPVYGRDKPEDKILRNCYLNALQIADEHQIDSIAFPAISTGVFGYPVKDAAQVAMNTVKEISGQLKFVKRVRFVLWSEQDFEIHQSVLKKV